MLTRFPDGLNFLSLGRVLSGDGDLRPAAGAGSLGEVDRLRLLL